MARASNAEIPLIFPAAPAGLRSDLERLAGGVQAFLKNAPNLFAPRWQRVKGLNPRAATFGFAAHFVLVEDQEIDFDFPRPNVLDGGKELLVIRRTDTGILRAHGVGCNIDDAGTYIFPAEPRAYRFFFDGEQFWSYERSAVP